MTPDLVDKKLFQGDFNEEENFKCFLKCIFIKTNAMSPAGDIQAEMVENPYSLLSQIKEQLAKQSKNVKTKQERTLVIRLSEQLNNTNYNFNQRKYNVPSYILDNTTFFDENYNVYLNLFITHKTNNLKNPTVNNEYGRYLQNVKFITIVPLINIIVIRVHATYKHGFSIIKQSMQA